MHRIVIWKAIFHLDPFNNKCKNRYIMQIYPATLFTTNWCGHALHSVARGKLRMIRPETINWRYNGNRPVSQIRAP